MAFCMSLGVNRSVDQFVFAVTAARFRCWWWVCSSSLRSSCCTSGGNTRAPKLCLMTSDPAAWLRNTLDLDQTTNEQHQQPPYSPGSLLHHYNKQLDLNFSYATDSVHDLHLHRCWYPTCCFCASFGFNIWRGEREEAMQAHHLSCVGGSHSEQHVPATAAWCSAVHKDIIVFLSQQTVVLCSWNFIFFFFS